MNIENEKSVLGACFLEPDAVDLAVSLLSPMDFSVSNHREIFRAITVLADKRLGVNPITLGNELGKDLEQIGGQAYLAELMDFTPSAAESLVRHYCGEIREQAKKRKLKGIAAAINNNLENLTADEIQGRAEEALFALVYKKNEGPVHLGETAHDVIKSLEKAYHNKGEITGLRTGIDRLDNLMCGLNKPDLTIIAGRPSMGKSALGGNIVENLSIRGDVPSLIFSGEMGKEQWAKRILCSLARVDGTLARVGNINEGEWGKLQKCIEEIYNSRVWIDDTPGLHITELRARARRLRNREGIGLVVVDYLQLFQGTGDSRQQEIGSISRGLKAMAKELDIPVLALSQLNRKVEDRTNKRPVMADLRESGDIEQDADNVLLLYREAVYNPNLDHTKAEIIVGKQRNGPTGTIPATWLGEFSRFENREENREEPYQ